MSKWTKKTAREELVNPSYSRLRSVAGENIA